MVDTLLIDGHDVRGFDGAHVVGPIDGIYAPGTRRGEPVAIPGRHGRIGVRRPFDYYIITFTLWLDGDTEGEWSARLRNIASLIAGDANDGLVTLERQIDDDPSGTLSHTAPGEFITGLSPECLNTRTSRTVVQYYQNKGRWSDDGGTTWTLK